MRLISNEVEKYGNTPVEQWLTAFYTGKNLEKLDPDGVLYRFHLSHNDLDGLACHVVSTVYDCALNRFEIPLVDLTDALQYKNWDEIHVAHHRMPILHSICKAGTVNVKEALHLIFESCCRSVFYKPVGPKDQIILLITDLGGITDSMFDEFYEEFGDRFQVIVIDHHLSTTPDRGKCNPNQIFWYVTGYQEGNLQSATKNLFTATYGSYDAVHTTSTTSGRVSKKQETFVKQLTEYVEAVSKYDTGRWGEWLDRKTPDDADLSVQHQLFFNRMAWDSIGDVFHRIMISNYVRDMIYLLSMEDYVHTNRAYWEIVRNNLNELHKEFHDMHQLTLAYNPHVTLTVKIDPINGVYNPSTRHMIRLGDISADVQPVNNPLHPLVTFGIIELRKDQSQTRNWKYFSLCSRELMKKYKLDLFILVDEPSGTVSLRSMNNHGFEINCADIAQRNGGGGHKRAAGYPIPKVEVPEDADTDTEEDVAGADDWEDNTEEAEDGETEEAGADDSSEDSDEELISNACPSIGTHVQWAGYDWIVTHVVDTKMAYLIYMTLADVVPNWKVTWDDLQDACTKFANQLTEAQKACLKSVTAGNTSGKVFVATRDQMAGGFSYFRSNSSRRLNGVYWTSTEYSSDNAWSVITDRSLDTTYTYFCHVAKSDTHGFRPSVCVDLTRHNSGDSKGSDESKLNPELPNKNSLTLGNTVMFAGKQWIVSSMTTDAYYLTLNGVLGNSTWDNLQENCTNFANSLSEAQRRCLKHVTAGNTSGKVFVATYGQMNGGFSYFNSNDRRCVRSIYWTSTENSLQNAWGVRTDGSLNDGNVGKSYSLGFRPSIAIRAKELCNDHDISDELDDSEEEDSDEELHPIVDRDRVIRWAGINWRPLQQDDDLLYLTPYEPTDDVKICTYDDVDAVAAEWEVKHLSAFHRSLLVPIQINGKSYNVAPITLEHILNILDARNAKHAQICMPYGNVPYWTGSSAYTSDDTDDMVWCMNEKGQNVPVNKNAFLAFRPMICLHITNAIDGNLDDGKPIVLTHNIQNAYPSVGAHVYWAWNDWIITHVDTKMVYMTLADVVPDWYVAWNDLQDSCTSFANKFTEEERACLKSVTAGNTSGKVFVATYEQMDGDFSYFNSDSRRKANDWYWTSSEDALNNAWSVCTDGIFGLDGRSHTGGFRPSVCVDRTLCYFGNIEGSNESELNPELPDKDSLTIGNMVTFAGKQWIVSHKTDDICYLTLKDVLGKSTWHNLQENCTNFENSLTEAQRRCLTYVTAGNTSGKVFVATKDQMDGGFSYFRSNSPRSVGSVYWTSTENENDPVYTWFVYTDGSLGISLYDKSGSLGFRPSIAIWTKGFYN